jgi:hypothetical protein
VRVRYAGEVGELPRTEEEITAFVAAFEAGTLPKDRWTHGAHVLTGAWYVHELGEAAATDRMRLCVSRYNEAVGGKNTATSGYHETVTVFWIKVLAADRAQWAGMERAEFAWHCVETLAPVRNLLAQFYSYDVVGSTEARREWREPDLRAI